MLNMEQIAHLLNEEPKKKKIITELSAHAESVRSVFYFSTFFAFPISINFYFLIQNTCQKKTFITFARFYAMLKKFLKNIALVLFLNLLIKPFWILGIDRSVQNVVGA